MAAKKKSETVDHVDGGHPDDPPPSHEAAAGVGLAVAPAPDEALVATASAPKTWDGAVLIATDKLVFTSWNCNEMNDAEFSELVAEIEEGGFDEPADVIPSKEEPGHYLVLGGEHRTRAAHALQMKEVPCVIKTHLINADEATLKMWSVKRNNIKGRINAQKYMDLERSLDEKHQIKAEVARQKMLVRGELLKTIQGMNPPAPPPSGDGSGDDGTQASRDKKGEIKDRKKLLEALKNAETEVLLQSADTVEHGYLYFGQGDKGQKHLVVDESAKLAGLVKRAVAACKNDSAKIDDLLCAALEAELPSWENKGGDSD